MAMSVPTMAQTALTHEEVMQKVSTGQPFTLVFLKAGPTPSADEATMNELQKNHLIHLFTLEKEGKISIFGPVINDQRMKAIIVFNTTDKESVMRDLNADAYIRDGYLGFEIYDWFTIPGQRIP